MTSKHATYRPHFVVLLLPLEHVERARAVLYKIVTGIINART